MDLREVKLSGETLYEGEFVSISKDKVRLPNGIEGQRIVIRHPGAACVLAVTDEGKVVLVRQWRYAANQATLELPAGKFDMAGEDMAACAFSFNSSFKFCSKIFWAIFWKKSYRMNIFLWTHNHFCATFKFFTEATMTHQN